MSDVKKRRIRTISNHASMQPECIVVGQRFNVGITPSPIIDRIMFESRSVNTSTGRHIVDYLVGYDESNNILFENPSYYYSISYFLPEKETDDNTKH